MSKTRAKGTAFETEVVRTLQAQGFRDAIRNELNSPNGDIGGLPIVVECKNHKAMTLAAWVDQANASGQRMQKLAAVVHKRAGKNVSKAYVTMELNQFVELLAAYNS